MAQDGQKPFTDVAALMKERQKLEAWLAALEARRGSTPERVFARVFADYEARLDRVMSDLLTHRDALEARVRELDGRLNELETSEQQRRDQRAEMELRAMVGELGEEDFTQAAREVDEAIARATTEKGNVRLALEEANDLLRAATTPRPITPVPAAPMVAAPPARAPEPIAESHRNTAARQLAQQPTAPAPVPAAPAPTGPTIPPRPAPRPSAPVRAATVAEAERAAAASAPPVVPRAEPPAPPPPAQPVMAEPPAADPGNGMRGPAPSNAFDELAFLNSIVGEERRSAARPAAPQPQAPPPAAPPPPRPTSTVTLGDLGVMREDITGADSIRASRATGVASDVSGIVQEENVTSSLIGRAAEPPEDADMPLADNVTGNHPIVLRPAGDVAQHKTLRCNECSAMNYPTEWYCERCGAELAAL